MLVSSQHVDTFISKVLSTSFRRTASTLREDICAAYAIQQSQNSKPLLQALGLRMRDSRVSSIHTQVRDSRGTVSATERECQTAGSPCPIDLCSLGLDFLADTGKSPIYCELGAQANRIAPELAIANAQTRWLAFAPVLPGLPDSAM